MKSLIIFACLIYIGQATFHDQVDYTHNKPPDLNKCTLEEECDAGNADRVRKCSSLDLCYDWQGSFSVTTNHDFTDRLGHTKKHQGKDSKCPETETCARADGPDGEFYVCVLAMYCNVGSAAIYTEERNATWNGEWQQDMPFTCPNLKPKEISAAVDECSIVSAAATREEEFLKSIEYDKSL